ncbi:hypothetical protein CALVIDRAFT_558233 [Calocera viscosa TUFC12733]|uniref:Protein kinase domain-containing protein n=1 Tax=Calocera viscosa (strain TUFC12733) TaxID=1330018 RepID=A0A167H7K4_CALVF|nr:hypothetical protein CALVIDRAFT_558233 [Calocera viscosa TUFC12733]
MFAALGRVLRAPPPLIRAFSTSSRELVGLPRSPLAPPTTPPHLTWPLILTGQLWTLTRGNETSDPGGVASRPPSKWDFSIHDSNHLWDVIDATASFKDFRQSTLNVLAVVQQIMESGEDKIGDCLPIDKVYGPTIDHPHGLRGSNERATAAWIERYLLEPMKYVYSAITGTLTSISPVPFYHGTESDYVVFTESGDSAAPSLRATAIIEIKKKTVLLNIIQLLKEWFKDPDAQQVLSTLKEPYPSVRFSWPVAVVQQPGSPPEYTFSDGTQGKMDECEAAQVQLWTYFCIRSLNIGALVSDEDIVLCFRKDQHTMVVSFLDEQEGEYRQIAILFMQLLQLYRDRLGVAAEEWNEIHPLIKESLEKNFQQYIDILGPSPPPSIPPPMPSKKRQKYAASVPPAPVARMEPTEPRSHPVNITRRDEFLPGIVRLLHSSLVPAMEHDHVPDLLLGDVYDRGVLGTVQRGTWAQRNVVAKSVPSDDADKRSLLLQEASHYMRMRPLWGEVVPELLGLVENDTVLSLVLADVGDPIAALNRVEDKRDLFHLLEQVHQAGIYHGDIRPPNILRDDRGKLRLIDFHHATLHRCNGKCAELRHYDVNEPSQTDLYENGHFDLSPTGVPLLVC